LLTEQPSTRQLSERVVVLGVPQLKIESLPAAAVFDPSLQNPCSAKNPQQQDSTIRQYVITTAGERRRGVGGKGLSSGRRRQLRSRWSESGAGNIRDFAVGHGAVG
jgi:hypothetical protein